MHTPKFWSKQLLSPAYTRLPTPTLTVAALLDSRHPQALMRRAYAIDFASVTARDMFAASATPRKTRPVGMRFRVGDVYFHRQTAAFGVVLGWDDRRLAPLRGWGKAQANRLYAVHYSVVEFEDPTLDGPTLDGGLDGGESSEVDWSEAVSTRYIVEDNMLSIEQIWAGHLPEVHASFHARLILHAGRGSSPSSSEYLAGSVLRAYREAEWSLPLGETKEGEEGEEGADDFDVERYKQVCSLEQLWPGEGDEDSSYPWLSDAFALEHGFIPRHVEDGDPDSARGDTLISTREISRGLGFVPDTQLRARYPADGPYRRTPAVAVW